MDMKLLNLIFVLVIYMDKITLGTSISALIVSIVVCVYKRVQKNNNSYQNIDTQTFPDFIIDHGAQQS